MFRELYGTELDAALGYDNAVRHLAPHLAATYCNFPHGHPGHAAHTQALTQPRQSMTGPSKHFWDDDQHVRYISWLRLVPSDPPAFQTVASWSPPLFV